jgi:hypothetical protein
MQTDRHGDAICFDEYQHIQLVSNLAGQSATLEEKQLKQSRISRLL